MTTTEFVKRYFELAAGPDSTGYLAQFAPDAMVEDEGHIYRGVDAIRDWRGAVPPVSYGVRAVQSTAEETVAQVEVAGDFPGSPVELSFRFTFTGSGSIQALAIRT
jgi:hypothetical protein